MFARHVRALGSIACGCFLLLLPLMAAAQTNTHSSSTPRVVDPPAGVVLGGRGASIVRGDHTTPATADVPLVYGDRLRTAQDGAVLARVDERTVLWLADDSEVTLRGATDLQLIRGQMILLVDGWPVSPLEMLRRERLTLDAPGGAIAFVMPGDYEVTVDDDLDSTIVHVRAGEAVLKNGGEQVRLASSRSASRIGRLRVEKAPGKLRRSPLVDKGDRSDETWLALVQLRDPKRLWSARYLPPSLTPHAPYFERAGDWEWDEVHGLYWVPRVDASWQPFTNGAWTQASGGWVWRGAGGPWEGPTHHYGRCVSERGRAATTERLKTGHSR